MLVDPDVIPRIVLVDFFGIALATERAVYAPFFHGVVAEFYLLTAQGAFFLQDTLDFYQSI